MSGGRELAHVQPDLGDDHLGDVPSDAGDLIEDVGEIACGPDRRRCRATRVRADAGVRARGFTSGVVGRRARAAAGARRHGQVRQQRVDACRERLDLPVQRVDLVQQQPREFGVVIVELADRRLSVGNRKSDRRARAPSGVATPPASRWGGERLARRWWRRVRPARRGLPVGSGLRALRTPR